MTDSKVEHKEGTTAVLTPKDVETAENGATRQIQIKPEPFVDQRVVIRFKKDGRITTYTTDYARREDSLAEAPYKPLHVSVVISQPIDANLSATLAGVELTPRGYNVQLAHGGLKQLMDITKSTAEMPDSSFYDVVIFRPIYS